MKFLRIRQVARDEIYAADKDRQVGWINVNMQPIKKTIETYASKWVFTFTKYLTDQVNYSLIYQYRFNASWFVQIHTAHL